VVDLGKGMGEKSSHFERSLAMAGRVFWGFMERGVVGPWGGMISGRLRGGDR